MDELGEKLDALLHDPQQLGRIAQLASSLAVSYTHLTLPTIA